MSLKGFLFCSYKSNVRRRKMDKDFLKKLGLTDEIADKVMDQHDKDVQQLKDNNAELQSTNDSLNEQITSNAKQLKDLKKVAGDNEELQAKLDKAMSDSQEREKKLKDQIATQRKNFAVGNALRDAGAKNSKAVEALLDLDKVSLDDNGQLIGISDQIDSIKKSDSYLFNSESKPNVEFGAKGNPSNTDNKGEKSIVDIIQANMEKGK